MKRDPYTAISNVGSFLGYQLSEYTIQKIDENTSFNKMKLDLMVNDSGWMNIVKVEHHLLCIKE